MFRKLLLSLILLLSAPSFAWGATLYLDPDGGTFGPTDTVIMTVRVDNENECLNASRVVVHYPTDTLRAADFSKGHSIFSLWVEEPVIDRERGTVSFTGGIPGGYCGRIDGDPVLSNVLGRIIFTVTGDEGDAVVHVSDTSEVFLNDGQGTKASLETRGATLTLSPVPTLSENMWLAEVDGDETPPDPFIVRVESTRGVFKGNYYAVFSAVDKQSGIDHYEIYERGTWRNVSSPHKLLDQTLTGGVRVRAIDKAGNTRLGDYNAEIVPERHASGDRMALILVIIILLAALGGGRLYIKLKKQPSVTP